MTGGKYRASEIFICSKYTFRAYECQIIYAPSNKYGNTQLLEALRYNRAEFAEFLIDQRADVNIADNDGYTPLYSASQHGLNDMVQKLIDKKANVDVQNRFFDTPLIVALKR